MVKSIIKRDGVPEDMIRNKIKWLWICLPLLFALLWIPPSVRPDDDLEEIKVPEALNPAFEYLLALIGTGGNPGFKPQIVDGLLDFVAAPKKDGGLYYVDGVSKATSAYHEFVFEKDLAHVMKLSYNPELPSFITSPSSVRLSFWSGFGDGTQTLPKLWNYLEGMEAPVVVDGRETVENTPDINTGAYYRYDQDHTLILMKHKGNNVLISLSKQEGISDVGKIGVVLGDDNDWTYLYSDKKGLNKPGLGWVSSYMYEASSIIVYYETRGEATRVKCGAFKWLDAGWQNINMVRRHHIYRGLERFGLTYKAIVENPSLPDAAVMAEAFSKISAMKMEELQQLNRLYLKSMRAKYAHDPSLSSRWAADLLKDEQVEKMDVHELRSVLELEYFKKVLGKPYNLDIAQLQLASI
jgi:hypothetical protein